MRYMWAVGGIFLVAALGASLVADEKPKADAKDDAALVKRGEYLVNQVALCGNCHTPRNAKGELDMARHLQGAEIGVTPKKKPKEWEDKAPDITMSGIAGDWGADKLVKFLTTGLNAEGEKADPPMPTYKLAPEDARAVTAYLRSLAGEKKKDKKDDKKGDDKKKDGKEKDDD
jgi:mono/diheme cytochrome c family protein